MVAAELGLAPVSAAAQVPRVSLRARNFRPGEVIAVTVAVPRRTTQVLVTAFGGEWPAFPIREGRWQSLVGIDLETLPGVYALDASVRTGPEPAETQTVSRPVTIVARAFRTRTLTVAPEYVDPPPDVLSRINAETELLRDTLATRSGAPH